MKVFINTLVACVITFAITISLVPERVVVKKDVEIIKEQSSQEVKYKDCVATITIHIDHWAGNISNYPANDFMSLIDQCMEIKNK